MSLPRPVSAIILTVAVALFLPAGLLHAAQPNASCTFTTFSAPEGYTLNLVNGITDNGTVAGQLIDNATAKTVAFTYSSKGEFTEYTAPKSANTWLYGGNANGINAGSYQITGYPGSMYGFFLQGKQFASVKYPNAANTWLFDVNQAGAAVGSFSASQSVIKGFVLVNGQFAPIAYPKALLTTPQAISDNGMIVGAYSSNDISNGFLWQNGSFTTINYPGAKWGTGLTGINNAGTIVGIHYSGDDSYGFLYTGGVFKNIVYPGAKFVTTGGINNNGVISGQIYFTLTNTKGYTAVCK